MTLLTNLNFLKPAAKYVVEYFTKDSPEDAQEFAKRVVQKNLDQLPTVLSEAAIIGGIYSTTGPMGVVAYAGKRANDAANGDEKAKKLIFMGPQMLKDYNEYRILKNDRREYSNEIVKEFDEEFVLIKEKNQVKSEEVVIDLETDKFDFVKLSIR